MRKLVLTSIAGVSYVIGMMSLLYFMGFLMNVGVTKGVDGPSVLESVVHPALMNVCLLVVYFIVHSLMARPGFKRHLITMLPAGLERSFYVLIAGGTLFVVMCLWVPITNNIWSVQIGAAVYGLYALYILGWMIMVMGTFNIDHLSFFGLRQAWHSANYSAKDGVSFRMTWLYGIVRHPISLGWFIVVWTTPEMTLGHFILAVISTIYIILITPIEESDLRREIGNEYADYQEKVPRFIPFSK